MRRSQNPRRIPLNSIDRLSRSPREALQTPDLGHNLSSLRACYAEAPVDTKAPVCLCRDQFFVGVHLKRLECLSPIDLATLEQIQCIPQRRYELLWVHPSFLDRVESPVRNSASADLANPFCLDKVVVCLVIQPTVIHDPVAEPA